jgi:hypothetical protein
VNHLSSILHHNCAKNTQILFHSNIKAKSKPSPAGEIKIKLNKNMYEIKKPPEGGF